MNRIVCGRDESVLYLIFHSSLSYVHVIYVFKELKSAR